MVTAYIEPYTRQNVATVGAISVIMSKFAALADS